MRKSTHRYAAIIALLLSTFGAGQALGQTQEPLTVNADSLLGGEINGQPVKQLIGHMRFVQGALYGSADRAIQYLNEDRIELLGHVEIHQDTLSLYAPHVTYHSLTGIGHADGNVRLFDRDNELTAAEGDYDVNNQVARFHHHVTITQGKTSSLSDDLVYYRSTETSILTGHAEVRSDSGKMTADTIVHSRALDETTAQGSVVISSDTLRLHSDWFYNSGSTGLMLARGRVAVEDLKNRTTVFGDTLARFAKLNYTLVPRRPLLLYIDSSQVRDSSGKMNTAFDTMFVRSDTMKMYQGDSARFHAVGNVRLFRTTFSLTGGNMIYDQAKEIITVAQAKRQHIWNDSTEIDADSIAMLMKDRHVNRVFGIGNAFATNPLEEFPNSGRINQLQGESMMLVVEHDTAKRLYDMLSALSIYFLVSGDKPDGVNRSSGDTIRIDLKDRKVTRVGVISGAEGEYFPERFVAGRPQAFRLTAYERHTDLRPRREEFVVPWEASAASVAPVQEETPAPVPTSTDQNQPTPPPNKGMKRHSAH
jgi:lipopolysaccharide export system protein LptA